MKTAEIIKKVAAENKMLLYGSTDFIEKCIEVSNQFKVELSYEEINKMAEERFKIEAWRISEPVTNVTQGSLQINHKLAFKEGFKQGLQHREDKAVGFAEWAFNNLIKKYDGYIYGYSKIGTKERPMNDFYPDFLTSIKGK